MTTHEVTVRAFPKPDEGGDIKATCSCGAWNISLRYISRADLPRAVKAAQALGKAHREQKHDITITNHPHPVQGGNVWGHCSCMAWGTVQSYVRNVAQGIAERAVRSAADQHLKESTPR